MQRKALFATALAAVLVVSGFGVSAQAQDWGSMLKNLAGEAAQKAIEHRMDPQHPAANAQPRGAANPMLQINGAYDFTPGPVTLFQQNFGSTPVGAMPADLITNGSGQVVTVEGLPGRWLELRDGSTYKLHPRLNLPARFTVKFDVVPAAQQINDLSDFYFGFAHDNDVREYISDAYNGGAINNVDLQYLNGSAGNIVVSSSATSYHNYTDIDWRDFANQVMHVAIAVNDDQMTVYLGHMKIADSRLFEHHFTRYFYFSSSLNHKHDARLLVSNLRIGGFAPTAVAQHGTGAGRP